MAPQKRKEQVYEALRELDEPVSSAELAEILGWPVQLLNGTLGALKLLIEEGRVAYIGDGNHRRYFADPDISPWLAVPE